jgi:site-specific DNA recombinase
MVSLLTHWRPKLIHEIRYKTARCRKRYIVIPEQAEWVRKVFRWFVHERWSLRRIAQELTRNKVPTDHRSRKESWHYQSVARMLGCEKYKGVWSWGKTKVKRDPLSGKVSQEPRSPEEVKKWVRHMPDLQLIDDELWEAAQVRLAENRAALGRVDRVLRGRIS